jgi:YVTN family beta-propeller protein
MASTVRPLRAGTRVFASWASALLPACALQAWRLPLPVCAVVLACLACGGNTEPDAAATLSVVTSTSGEDADGDGYAFSLDGNPAARIGTNASFPVAGLAAGEHQLQIDDVAVNCELAGDNPRSVSLAPGETTQVTLVVTCHAVHDPAIIRAVPLEGSPYGVAVSQAGVIYAALIGTSSLVRGDLTTVTFGPLVGVGLTPPHVAFNPAGTIVYATLQTGQGLAAVDVATNSLLRTVPFTSDGFNLIVSPDGAVIYATTADGTLYVIDAETYGVITTLYVGVAANGLAFSPDGSVLYVSSRDDGTVVAIDPETNAVTRTYLLGGQPQRLAVAPDGSELYVANEAHGLDIVNVASGVVTSVGFGSAGYGLGLTPDGTLLYVLLPDAGEVRVLERASRAPVETIVVGGRPRNVAFAADGHTAVVTNEAEVVFLAVP